MVWVGADEMNRRRGHNYLPVFANLIAKRPILATLGEDSSDLEAFAAELLRNRPAVLLIILKFQPSKIQKTQKIWFPAVFSELTVEIGCLRRPVAPSNREFLFP